MKKLFYLCLIILVGGCGSVGNAPSYQLTDDVYWFKLKGSRYEKAWVYKDADSIRVHSYGEPNKILNMLGRKDQFFLKRSFDVDIMTVYFKYRRHKPSLPRQLNTDFNGNIFLGYRFDRIKIKHHKSPFGNMQSTAHRGISAGVFGGIGSTAITPWTTNNRITDEYNGLVLSRGMSVMYAVESLTFGLGIGWDTLTDRDRHVWLYQNEPWYGLTVSLNLN